MLKQQNKRILLAVVIVVVSSIGVVTSSTLAQEKSQITINEVVIDATPEVIDAVSKEGEIPFPPPQPTLTDEDIKELLALTPTPDAVLNSPVPSTPPSNPHYLPTEDLAPGVADEIKTSVRILKANGEKKRYLLVPNTYDDISKLLEPGDTLLAVALPRSVPNSKDNQENPNKK